MAITSSTRASRGGTFKIETRIENLPKGAFAKLKHNGSEGRNGSQLELERGLNVPSDETPRKLATSCFRH